MQRFALGALLFVVIGLLSGCASLARSVPWSSGYVPSSLDPEDVPRAIERAEKALREDDAELALAWMRVAAGTDGLSTDERDRVQVLLERAASQRITDLSKSGGDPEALAKLVELDLPRQIAVSAGLQAARVWVEDDEPMKAFKLLKKLDVKFPLHHERQAAGDLLCAQGLKLIADGPGFLTFFTTRDEGQEVLEYVVLHQPWARRNDEAYAALSKLYEEEREWPLAIERAKSLVLDYPASPLRIATQARIPHLRLRSLKSPEYDRVALQTARSELEEWLIGYANHPLETAVRVDLGDCLRRLSDNDMIVSRFYDRVDNTFGARWHAARAIEEARAAGDGERRQEAETWLAGLPKVRDSMVLDHPPAPLPIRP